MTEASSKRFSRQREAIIVKIYLFCNRKYASGATLENSVESAFESFVFGVKQQDGVIDLPAEIMKMVYNLLSTMCFGKQ